MCIILRSGTLLAVTVTRRRRTIRITFSSRPSVCVRVCVLYHCAALPSHAAAAIETVGGPRTERKSSRNLRNANPPR